MDLIESQGHGKGIKGPQRVLSDKMSAQKRQDPQGMGGVFEDDRFSKSEDEWDEPPEYNDIKAGMQEIKSRISHQELRVDTEEQLQDLMHRDEWKYISYVAEDEQDNFLHMAAEGIKNHCLIKFLVEKRGKLMVGTDRSSYHPLHLAIKEKNTDFILAVLDSKVSRCYKLQDVLSHKGGLRSENCIHIAIQVGLEPQLIVRLIEESDEKTLAEQDGAKLTPLHCAVDYKNCRKGQFEVVQALLKHGGAALDKLGGIHGALSPYQYHQKTREIEKRKVEKEEAEGLKGLNEGTGSQRPPTGRDNLGVRDNAPPDRVRRGDEDDKQGKQRYVDDKRGDKPRGKRGEDDKRGDKPRGKRGEDDQVDDKHKKSRDKDDKEDAKERKNLADAGLQANTRQDPSQGRGLSSTIRGDSTESQVKSPTTGIPVAGSSMAPPAASENLPNSHNGNSANVNKPRKARMGPQPGMPRRDGRFTKTQKSGIPPDDNTADEISKELKLNYLRSIFKRSPYSGGLESTQSDKAELRNHDRAVKFLYGDNKENRHICFNFLDGPSKTTADKFKATYAGFQFDPVLQYVAFRRVEFASPELPPRGGGRMSKVAASTGKGRKDMEVPFAWLHEKRVTNIIKVIVDDLELPAHKDESIQRALTPFDIEILDWRKIDLCPDTICESCTNLREIHLWWSGNNGILRAWSEPEGLARLLRLEVIQIHQTQELESDSWTDDKITIFRNRLQSLRHDQNKDRERGDKLPKIHVPDPIKAINSPGHQSTGPAHRTDPKIHREAHKWLQIMDTFADGMYNIKPDRDAGFFKSLPQKLQREVKVALIDDGVQFGHESLQEKIQDGWSFDDGYDGVDLPGARRPFHESSTGHGTLMANMICRICPNAKIFACRLNVYPGDGNKSHFSATSAADAVEYCATRGFDIISMSWTIKKPDDTQGARNDNNDFVRLQNALDKAAKNGALLFCSAPDEGDMSDEKFHSYYPVGYEPLSPQIFKIGAATSANKEADSTGKPSLLDFILPGHEVKERGNDTIKVGENLRSGSSVATALAAGLAALVIHCVKIGAIETIRANTTKPHGEGTKQEDEKTGNNIIRMALDPTEVQLEDLADVKKSDSMKRIFSSIPRERKPGKGGRYLEVDNTFENPGKRLVSKDSTEDEKVRTVCRLATNFVNSAKLKL